MSTTLDRENIKNTLERGVSVVYPSHKSLEAVLTSGKKLRIYTGIDPTGNLHIGHMVVLRKMRQFQDLGHDIIVLIGDFTAQIGDPTDKLSSRKVLSIKEIEENAKNYKKLVGKILDTKKTNCKFMRNQVWSNKLKPTDVINLASNFTVMQLIERDMFQERIKNNKEIRLNEFLYPIFQAYDSVAMNVDLEIGGNDQIFNMLAGRSLMKKLKNRDKFVLATKLLTDGSGSKMGKTEGGAILLNDDPSDIFGKVMSFPDSMILIGFEILTDNKITKIVNPRDAKAKLAYDIVRQLYSAEIAKKAEDNFNKQFRDKEVPDNIEKIKIFGSFDPATLLVNLKAVHSKSQARRLVEQGGVKIDGTKITDPSAVIAIRKDMIIQVGKRGYWKIV